MGIAKIEFDYREALKQANKLDEIANNIKHLASENIENTLSTLNGGWQGDSASAFIAKGRTLKDNTLRTASDLTNAADKIRKIAKQIHDAEVAAFEIANKRTY